MTLLRTWFWPLLIGLLFVTLAIFTWGAFRKIQLDDTSSETAIQLLETSLSSRTADSLIAAAHPDWLATMPAESIRSYLEYAINRLGNLEAMNSITGESTAGMLPVPGESLEASYVINLQMGDTTFDANLDLRQENGEWLISNLMLNAPMLME